MLIEPILGYKSSWRILGLLLETPRKLVSRKELFEHTKLGNAPLSLGLKRLSTAGIIIKEKKGKKEFYYLDTVNENLKLIQELWERERKSLRNLDYEIKVILTEFLRMILDIIDLKKIILFGSHAKGTASVKSDIDLALISKEEIKNEIEVTRIIKVLEKKYKKEIQVHYFTEKSFEGKSKLIKEIKENGINLLLTISFLNPLDS